MICATIALTVSGQGEFTAEMLTAAQTAIQNKLIAEVSHLNVINSEE